MADNELDPHVTEAAKDFPFCGEQNNVEVSSITCPSYNEKATTYNGLGTEYNEKVTAYNDVTTAYNEKTTINNESK